MNPSFPQGWQKSIRFFLGNMTTDSIDTRTTGMLLLGSTFKSVVLLVVVVTNTAFAVQGVLLRKKKLVLSEFIISA